MALLPHLRPICKVQVLFAIQARQMHSGMVWQP